MNGSADALILHPFNGVFFGFLAIFVLLLILAGGISTGLAFTNMLPIPGLDGNAIVITLVEMVRGKKLSRKSEQVINVIGFVMIIGLVIFALASDIIRLSR